MLVFISDLHFVDETAGKHNIPASAFEKFLSSVESHAKKVNPKELKIVFLGDIFDLIRTTQWFEEDEEDRPWGKDTPKMEKRALSILKNIEDKNRKTFDLFNSESIKKRFGDKAEAIYIPGNHDRLCVVKKSIRSEVVRLLGLNINNKENFQHHFSDPDYSVYAIHGHCFDKFNYEGGPDLTDKDYELVPIGDPITTELAAKLPFKLMKNIEARRTDLSKEERDRLERNFQEIDNIRPFSAVLKWLLHQVEINRHIKSVIEDTVDEVVTEFEELEFVKNWYERHDKWYNPFDSADKIQAVLFFLKQFKILSSGKLFELADKITNLFSEDELVKGAVQLISEPDTSMQYIVMGHTHHPLKEALARSNRNGKYKEYVYINTGTWRKRFYECKHKSGFIGWKDMSYALFYTAEEKPNRHNLPVFESWTGSVKREEKEMKK